MKFDYCLGNPPYQEQKGGTKNVDIWPEFVKETAKISDKSCMIHPGRWIVAKKNMQKTRDSLIQDGLKTFKLYRDSHVVFPNATIDGGVSITYFETNFNGDIKYKVDNEPKTRIYDINKKIFLTVFEEEIYSKLFKDISPSNNMLKYIFGHIGAIGNCIGYDKYSQMQVLKDSPENMKNPIKIWAGTCLGYQPKYKWQYIEKSELPKCPDVLLKKPKLMLGVAGRQFWSDKQSEICAPPVIIGKNVVADSHLFIIPATERERELNLIQSLFMTKTARYAMTLTMKSICCMGFENIPDYLELEKLLPENELFTDEWFYKTFNFSEELINEINFHIKPYTDSDAKDERKL